MGEHRYRQSRLELPRVGQAKDQPIFDVGMVVIVKPHRQREKAWSGWRVEKVNRERMILVPLSPAEVQELVDEAARNER